MGWWNLRGAVTEEKVGTGECKVATGGGAVQRAKREAVVRAVDGRGVRWGRGRGGQAPAPSEPSPPAPPLPPPPGPEVFWRVIVFGFAICGAA